MNKNIIIWVLAALLVVSAGAAFYFSTKGPLLVVGESNKAVCDTLPLYTGSLGNGGPSESNAPPYIAQDICHMVFAVEKKDAMICSKIKTLAFKGGCYSEVANKTGDTSICDTAPADAKDACYSKMAERLGSAACDKIQVVDQRDDCLSSSSSRNSDPSICKKITNINRRDSCYMNLAYNNPSLCNEVVTPQMKQDCQRNAQRR